MSQRDFRTPDSYYAERVTREMIEGFLAARGFRDIRDERKFHGKVESQTIHATAPDGSRFVMRVRLCWRRRTPKETQSAAQILPKIRNDDWEGTLAHKVSHERSEGITHSLFVQRERDNTISHAALISNSELVAVWCAQRDASKALIAAGRLGRRKKNHAMNGSSPTLWLLDEKAPEVNDALWKHPGVIDLLKLEVTELYVTDEHNDSFDDLPGMDYSLLGSDNAKRTSAMRSQVKRDSRVRKEVVNRAQGKCERSECGAYRNFPGFLDVHHILGVEKSDRVWNCVALCPNCHREAHSSPAQEEINARLLQYANGFRP